MKLGWFKAFYHDFTSSTRPVKPPLPFSLSPPSPPYSPFSSSLFVLIPGAGWVLPGFGECLVSKGNWHLTCNFMVSLHLPLMSGPRLGLGCGGRRDGVGELLNAPPRVSSSPSESSFLNGNDVSCKPGLSKTERGCPQLLRSFSCGDK